VVETLDEDAARHTLDGADGELEGLVPRRVEGAVFNRALVPVRPAAQRAVRVGRPRENVSLDEVLTRFERDHLFS